MCDILFIVLNVLASVSSKQYFLYMYMYMYTVVDVNARNFNVQNLNVQFTCTVHLLMHGV